MRQRSQLDLERWYAVILQLLQKGHKIQQGFTSEGMDDLKRPSLNCFPSVAGIPLIATSLSMNNWTNYL